MGDHREPIIEANNLDINHMGVPMGALLPTPHMGTLTLARLMGAINVHNLGHTINLMSF